MAEKSAAEKHLFEFERPVGDLFRKIEELNKLAEAGKMDMTEEIKMVKKRIDAIRQEIFAKLTPYQVVQIARHIMRPTTYDYIDLIFRDFVELHGDRNFGDDNALIGGIALLDNKPVVVIGHQKGHTTKELISRCFGMAHPEGYRKALRLMRLAQRFNRPVISFVDIQGAYPGLGAEERGQAEAIAKNLREMIGLTVPFITVVTGEGGSGGALGIGMGNRVLMLEFAVYSVISPEGCASILFRDAKRAAEAAEVSKITAKDLLEFGIIDDIVKEPIGGAHNDHKLAASNVKTAILKHLGELSRLSPRELIADRYNKYRRMGIYSE